MLFSGTVCAFLIISGPSGEWPVRAVTKTYRALYTPPIICVKPLQAETIIAAVGFCLLGLVQI